MAKKVLLKDVAARAGVSIFTVSSALSGNRKVKNSTRDLIIKLAAEMGYERDAAGAMLAGRRQPQSKRETRINIGIVGTENISGFFAQPQLAAMRERGFEPVALQFPGVEILARTLETWWHQGISGLIIDVSADNRESRRYLDEAILKGICFSRFSVVTIGPSVFDNVRDIAGNYMREAMRRVTKKGYSRIAVILRKTDNNDEDDARLGAILLMKERLRGQVAVNWQEINLSSPTLPKKTQLWLQDYHPDAVIMFPGGGWWLLDTAGFEYPRDFAFYAVSLPGGSPANIAGMVHRKTEYFKAAVEMIQRQLRLGYKGIPAHPIGRDIVLDAVEGASLPEAVRS